MTETQEAKAIAFVDGVKVGIIGIGIILLLLVLYSLDQFRRQEEKRPEVPPDVTRLYTWANFIDPAGRFCAVVSLGKDGERRSYCWAADEYVP